MRGVVPGVGNWSGYRSVKAVPVNDFLSPIKWFVNFCLSPFKKSFAGWTYESKHAPVSLIYFFIMATRREALRNGLGLACAFTAPSCMAGKSSVPHMAMHWQPFGDMVQCELCPHECTLENGKTGICRVRKNKNGTLVTLGYANPCAVHVDPIEKKPLYHVLPGARAYSVAIAGCNFRCKNCQNWTISQQSPLETRNEHLPPQKLVEEAVRRKCTAIAYTYSEPVVWYEWMYDCAKLARQAGLKNLMITCGYVNEAPLRQLAQYMDAANVDLKSFDDSIYRKLNAGRLQPILDTLKLAKKLGIWVEITNLIVPQWTDDPAMIGKMCDWITANLGDDVPLHFSRFSPMHKLAHLSPTPVETLMNAKAVAGKEGLKHVYVGNVAVDTNTYCPSCKKAVVVRQGYLVKDVSIKNGACSACGAEISGIWTM
ncbi:MAG: AmmeMemoRadiSam system radical SAM enzyme [Chitinivibrionales bacterium]|nr:AmmeMemoRadiSam system radical SAM enzyme [Chitinivibrionales bacterium]